MTTRDEEKANYRAARAAALRLTSQTSTRVSTTSAVSLVEDGAFVEATFFVSAAEIAAERTPPRVPQPLDALADRLFAELGYDRPDPLAPRRRSIASKKKKENRRG